MPDDHLAYTIRYCARPYFSLGRPFYAIIHNEHMIGTVLLNTDGGAFISEVAAGYCPHVHAHPTLGLAIGFVIDAHQSGAGYLDEWPPKALADRLPRDLSTAPPLTPTEVPQALKPREPFTDPPMRIVQLIAGAHGTLYALDDHGRAWAYAENFTSDGRDSSAWQLLSPLPRSP